MAVEMADHLLVSCHDMERLQRLLTHASDTLLGHFFKARGEVQQLLERAGKADASLQDLNDNLGDAVTALQFQDMASQLIAHTHQRLHFCAVLLAGKCMGDDEDGSAVLEAAPERPNPVTQDEVDAGSIELF